MTRPTDKPLTKADTVALWHAVNWMDTVVREWRKDKERQDALLLEQEAKRLLQAKRALRKVNALRRQSS